MKFKGTGILFAVLLAFVFPTFAAEVSTGDAQQAVRGWVVSNGSSFGALGAVTGVSAEKDATGRVLWYVVTTEKGAAVVAPDDEIEPIVAVLPGSDGTIPAGHPLRAMLQRDLPVRLAEADEIAQRKLASSGTAAPSPAARKWAALKTRASQKLLNADGNPATVVRWLDGWNSPVTRVLGGSRVQTLRFWNQTDSPYFNDEAVFNRDTPGGATCGCVATAGSSVLHYFRVPGANTVSHWCQIGPDPFEEDAFQMLTTSGLPYDWSLIDNLDLDPDAPIDLPPAALDLLARVALDCGIGSTMNYNADGYGSSGSYTTLLGESFRDVFNVSCQVVTQDGNEYGAGVDVGRATYDKIIYNQIRGGAPVVLGIRGHEVVATGYGIDADRTNYTYVFLGWGGSDDAWYNLPTIRTKATVGGDQYVSTFIDELLTEISTDGRCIPIVGQVKTFEGEPAAGATVRVSDGQVTTTDANGYWGVRVARPATGLVTVQVTYGDLPTSTANFLIGDEAVPRDEARRASRLAAALPAAAEIRLESPSVTTEGLDFSTLNEALMYVAESIDPEAPSTVHTVELFRDAPLVMTDYQITFDCVIRSREGMTNTVKRTNGTGLIVDRDCTATFENVRLESGFDGPALTIRSGATAVLRNDAAFEEIAIEPGGRLVLEGALNYRNEYRIDCASAAGLGGAFATYRGDWADISGREQIFVNKNDPDLRGKLVKVGSTITLVWTTAPVPASVALASLTVNGETLNFTSLDQLFKYATADSTVTILEPGIRKGQAEGLVMTNRVTVAHDVTIGARAPLRIVGAPETYTGGFDVMEGGRLTVSNVVFSAYEMRNHPFIGVLGGDVEFQADAGLENIVVRRQSNTVNGSVYANNFNPVCVTKGSLALRQWSSIRSCLADISRVQNTHFNGGAVYLDGEGCELVLDSGEITDCTSREYGGGVYVGSGAKVRVSGFAQVRDNLTHPEEATPSASDVYVREPDAIVVTGPLTGQRIGVHHYLSALAQGGRPFAVLDAEGLDAADLERTAAVFFNDVKKYNALGAVALGETFYWSAGTPYAEPEAIDPGPRPVPDEPEDGPEPEPEPEPEPGPEPEPVPVVCQPFAFTAIEPVASGWKLTLAPATAYCTYTLKTSDDLTAPVAEWTAVGAPKTLQPGDAFEFTGANGELKRFWLVIGEDGVEPAP